MVTQGEKTVAKSPWHPELMVVFGTQDSPHPLTKAGGAAAQVHRHIKDFTNDAAHQLALGMGRQLVVQAPQHSPA